VGRFEATVTVRALNKSDLSKELFVFLKIAVILSPMIVEVYIDVPAYRALCSGHFDVLVGYRLLEKGRGVVILERELLEERKVERESESFPSS
jgi:hypothetical protein